MRLRTPVRAAVLFATQAIPTVATVSGSAHAEVMAGTPQSHGTYRLPFADGTHVKIFWDFTTHRPPGRVDIVAINGSEPYRVVAAAAGRVAAIEDRYSKRQSGDPGVVCHQNYMWIAHPNGEWTNYSHLTHDSVTTKAGLKVGDEVRAGQYLGDEGEVGCAMFEHVHFEVAVPDAKNPLDSGGFLTDNESAKRERNRGSVVWQDITPSRDRSMPRYLVNTAERPIRCWICIEWSVTHDPYLPTVIHVWRRRAGSAGP